MKRFNGFIAFFSFLALLPLYAQVEGVCCEQLLSSAVPSNVSCQFGQSQKRLDDVTSYKKTKVRSVLFIFETYSHYSSKTFNQQIDVFESLHKFSVQLSGNSIRAPPFV